MSFVPLHVHSHYSLLDGLGSPKGIVLRAKELGFTAVALTDHGNMYGAIEFYKAAISEGIKPIVGSEVYITSGSRFDKTKDEENKIFHMILLAQNYEGYRNLMELITKAHLEGFYYKPRMDFGLLKAHSKGLMALSGCLASELANAVLNKTEKEQIEVIKKYQEIFGKDNFYLEMQDHPFLDDQKNLNRRLIELSKLTGAELVATQDSHYLRKEDAAAQDILLCVQTQSTLEEEKRMKFEGDFSIQSYEEMKTAFSETPEALENTLKIAEKCNLEIEFNKNLIPKFKTPGNETAQSYLKQLCEEGFNKKYTDGNRETASKQLQYELEVVHNMGFDDYFLIVYDFVKFAKDAGITVGPGRGSAAGSVITYCLNITQLDPLKYGLIFERFLNPERISMPDIDIDFADNRRDEVLHYVAEKYGRECVAQIITFGTMAARAAVRDVGRAMGYPYSEVDKISKLVPPPIQGRHTPLKISIENDPGLKNVYQTDPRAKNLLDKAIQLEGTVRHAGTHASAVVMSQEPLVNYTPLQKTTGQGEEIITQFSMKPIADIGLLKMDFLGLKNLTIIQNTLKLVKFRHQIDIDVENLPMDDKQTFELLQKADTTGVFQLESAGMRRYIKELKPTNFGDIVAMISLYRPGPMPWIPQYIKGKHNPESVRYTHPSFEKFLKETNGVAVYQEQVFQIAREFAGFTLGEADILRKAVGKKNPKLLKEQKDKFVQGAINLKHDEKFAVEVFETVVEPFAAYGFNKAHGACYGMISYQTAYLKAHYPIEFMAAIMSCDHGNTDRIVLEMNECNEMGISVLPPSVNDSFSHFTVVDDKTIRFGLGAIKGLGEGVIQDILEIRKSGKFLSLENFIKRVPEKTINKKTIEALAYSGALDEFGDRKVLAESYMEMSDFAKQAKKVSNDGQTDIFGMMDAADIPSSNFKLKEVKSSTLMEKLSLEKKFMGLYVSGHPLKGLKKYLAKKINLIESLTKKHVSKIIKIGGIVSKMKRVLTKAGSYMLYMEIEDPTGRIEVVVFPKVYTQYQHLFKEDQLLIMEGRLDFRRDTLQFSCDSMRQVSLDSMIKNAKEENLYNPNEKISRKQRIFEEGVLPSAKQEEVALRFAPCLEEKDPLSDELSDPRNMPVTEIVNKDWSENPYIIEFSGKVDTEKLERLKKLLLQYQGERAVEIHLRSDEELKKMKVPFGVKLNEELKKAIAEII